jgi:hypothetical protein
MRTFDAREMSAGDLASLVTQLIEKNPDGNFGVFLMVEAEYEEVIDIGMTVENWMAHAIHDIDEHTHQCTKKSLENMLKQEFPSRLWNVIVRCVDKHGQPARDRKEAAFYLVFVVGGPKTSNPHYYN